VTRTIAKPVELADDIDATLQHLVRRFFRAVSFGEGGWPPYGVLYELFIDGGLLIKNSASVPEIASVEGFIAPRQRLIDSGELTSFFEEELSGQTQSFGRVAQRFSVYRKSGVQNGKPFVAKGVISTQFVETPSGWKISSMAWDDERPGLALQRAAARP
jgi:hypothetical protein